MRKITVFLALACLVGSFTAVGCAPQEGRTKYQMSLAYAEGKLTGSATVQLFNRSDEPRQTLDFYLLPNAYREGASVPAVSELYRPAAYYMGESYGEIVVREGKGGAFSVCGEDENLLRVTLSEPLAPKSYASLSFEFETTLAAVEHRLGVGRNAVNLYAFYPVPIANGEACSPSPLGEPFTAECADYEVSITLPPEYGCAYAGNGVADLEKNTYHIIIEDARDCTIVLGKEMCVEKKQVGNVCVESYAFGKKPSERVLLAAAESLSFYGEKFGAYPRSRYAVVETNLCVGGMEGEGISLLSDGLRERELLYATVHETAHQWWYARVGSNQNGEAWQDEGLAEYSAALFFDGKPSYGYQKGELMKNAESSYRAYFSVLGQLSGEMNTQMSRPLSSYSGEYEYENIAYHKGMLLFSRLHAYVGERSFFQGLKKYAQTYRGKIATRENLLSCFGGNHAARLAQSFLDGKAVI